MWFCELQMKAKFRSKQFQFGGIHLHKGDYGASFLFHIQFSKKRHLQRKFKPQQNLVMNTNPCMCRICHTLISHWLRNLGYVQFELSLHLTFGASTVCQEISLQRNDAVPVS